jgi:hypothetical protein
VERCKHVKSQATTVYFRLGKLGRVSTYVQHVWEIIGHVTVEAGNTVGTDGVPPHYYYCFALPIESFVITILVQPMFWIEIRIVPH